MTPSYMKHFALITAILSLLLVQVQPEFVQSSESRVLSSGVLPTVTLSDLSDHKHDLKKQTDAVCLLHHLFSSRADSISATPMHRLLVTGQRFFIGTVSARGPPLFV